MIHLILGKQGSGKTLFLVKMAYEYYKAGKSVYSNVSLNFPYIKINYKDIIEHNLENGIVILDEIHLLLPARASMRNSSRKICDGFLSMVRKKGLVIYGSTQTLRKVDIRFRDERDFTYIATKYAYINKNFIEVLHNQNLNKKIPIIIKLEVQETFSGQTINTQFLGNDLFKLYNTSEIIKVDGLE